MKAHLTLGTSTASAALPLRLVRAGGGGALATTAGNVDIARALLVRVLDRVWIASIARNLAPPVRIVPDLSAERNPWNKRTYSVSSGIRPSC